MKYKAFTLIEMIVVIGIMTVIAAFVIPISINQIYYSRAESIANIVASSIYSQQQNSFNGYENKEYGVYIQSNKLILYTGDTYATNTSIKEINTESVTLSASINGGNEIHFVNNSLKPSKYGTVSASYGDSVVTVDINSEGMVSVNR